MNVFDWQARTRLIFGNGSLAQLGELAQEIGGRRALLVTDAGIVAAGHAGRAVSALQAAGLTVAMFDAAQENPTTEDVDSCVAAARAAQADILIALGGGSAIDTAKGANFLLTSGGRMADYRGDGKATQEMLPLIAIPTTAGTGSEVQRFALISEAETHQKMACGDVRATPRIALLDPELTLSCPRSVTANAGIDAIAHALETAVTRPRNAISLMYSREAYRLLTPNLPRVLDDPGDLEARGMMLMGATFAGLAIENSMLGAAHAAANPLTAHFGLVHGQAVGMMLPYIVRFNAELPAANGVYRERAGSADELILLLRRLLAHAGFPRSLAESGVTADTIPFLAAEAAAQWTAGFNPRDITTADFDALYRKAFHGAE